MNYTLEQLLLLTHEAFLRRAAKVNAPFMLKGSFVTREYFDNPDDRIPGDLDWLYLEQIDNVENARQIFNQWALLVTEMEMNDGVRFESFAKNSFWRMIDYAMDEDFPTVNTDLVAWIGEQRVYFGLDISFNLPVQAPPIPLTIHPEEGDAFVYPYTPHIGLQVAWKIHQTLVRLRFKDLLDLVQLVKHDSFDEAALVLAKNTVIAECKAGGVDLRQFQLFLQYEFGLLNPQFKLLVEWDYWRNNVPCDTYTIYSQFVREFRESPTLNCPNGWGAFRMLFRQAFEGKGWTPALLD